jgi:hypothetical protein
MRERLLLAMLACLWLCVPTNASEKPNYVLSLDGDGDYVQLPPNIINDLDEATIEGWVKWERFTNYSRFSDFGRMNQTMSRVDDHGRELRDYPLPWVESIYTPGALQLYSRRL